MPQRFSAERIDALISVLNVGFERGAVVTRLERQDRGFVEVPSEVYAPRVLAGIAGLKETLEDRAVPLFLLNPLGLFRRQLRDGHRRRWCYELDAEQLGDLRMRYGAGAVVVAGQEVPSPYSVGHSDFPDGEAMTWSERPPGAEGHRVGESLSALGATR